MSNGDAAGTLVGILPLALLGGMTMRMTDWMMGYPERPVRRVRRRRRRAIKRPRRFGDFSNVGF